MRKKCNRDCEEFSIVSQSETICKKMTDTFLIDWALGNEKLRGKSTKSVISMVKKAGKEVYRYKSDGGCYLL